MQILDDTKQAVDPIRIARNRVRMMGVAIPPVVRPVLLTDQLKGVCRCRGCSSGLDGCTSCARGLDGMGGGGFYLDAGAGDLYPSSVLRGLGGLGQIDPGSLALEINTMLAAARSFWNALVNALGISAGAREADVITPVQDKITNTILAPAVQMGINDQNYTCMQMRQMLGVIQQARVEFKSFLVNTTWQDGRAAQQALVWLEGPLPASTSGAWFHQVESDFTGEVNAKCGTSGGGSGGVPPGTQVIGNETLIPLILGAAFFLLRR